MLFRWVGSKAGKMSYMSSAEKLEETSLEYACCSEETV